MDIKPDFVPKQAILETALAALLLFLVHSPFLILLFIDNLKGDAAVVFKVFGYLACLVPVLGGLGYYFWKKFTYNASEYHFHGDRVSYSESFFNQEEKEVTYDRIIEVIHQRNIIQRMFGTGSIILQTQATTNVQGGSGLKVPDVFNSQDKYKNIKLLIDDFKKRS